MKNLLNTFLVMLATCGLTAQTLEPALNDATDNGDGSYTNWFGTFTPASGSLSNSDWVSHLEHGNVYLEAHEENLWVWDPNVAALGDEMGGWVYTNRTVFPYFYILGMPSKYLLFLSGVRGPDETPRVFLDTQTLDKVFLSKAPVSTIVDIAAGNENFTSLVAAVTAADLVDTLSGDGPFTVLAPVNSAFAALDPAVLDDLLTNPASKPALTDILTYHVIPGRLTSGQLGMDVGQILSGEYIGGYIQTVNGADLQIETTPFGVLINGTSMVTTPDIETSNGIIHVIDEVLLPPADIVDTAIEAGFSTLVAAVQAAGLEDALRDGDSLTVFAPTDDAFAALGQDTLDSLLNDPETLGNILTYHVIAGKVYAGDVSPGDVEMLNGDTSSLSISEDGQLMIDDATIVITDVPASNGVIHVIDTVILPPAG